ncbi:hypothetical protein GCM10020000_47150 [Streptomyces olivoverticillatus]
MLAPNSAPNAAARTSAIIELRRADQYVAEAPGGDRGDQPHQPSLELGVAVVVRQEDRVETEGQAADDGYGHGGARCVADVREVFAPCHGPRALVGVVVAAGHDRVGRHGGLLSLTPRHTRAHPPQGPGNSITDAPTGRS